MRGPYMQEPVHGQRTGWNYHQRNKEKVCDKCRKWKSSQKRQRNNEDAYSQDGAHGRLEPIPIHKLFPDRKPFVPAHLRETFTDEEGNTYASY